jgi:hypothetical protein
MIACMAVDYRGDDAWAACVLLRDCVRSMHGPFRIPALL